MEGTNRHWKSLRLPVAVCGLLVLAVGVVLFGVDIRYGFPHFDTYQYSASVGSASGFRPMLPGMEGLPEFQRGAELVLPGIYWFKIPLFKVLPYSLTMDQGVSFALLVSAAALAAILLRRSGFGTSLPLVFFALVLCDPTFLTNVTGTRPEALAVLLLLGGLVVLTTGTGRARSFTGGLLLGLAGVVHVYAALLGPMMALAAGFAILRKDSIRNLCGSMIAICAGLACGWATVGVFWYLVPDAWALFRMNLSVQRGFHHDPLRFAAYLKSFKLGGGWFLGLLLVTVPTLAGWKAWQGGQGLRRLLVPLVVAGCCLFIPLAYMVLRTDQYFYGVMIWPALAAALVAVGLEGLRAPRVVLLLMAAVLAGGLVRLPVRAWLGVELRETVSCRELRKQWLADRAAGAPRLYLFTRDWDLAADVGVKDWKFYTFPLPIAGPVMKEFEGRAFHNVPEKSLIVFDRDYQDTCPFVNPGAFDPAKSGGWELLATQVWHYDLTVSKPPARIWELWRKKKTSD